MCCPLAETQEKTQFTPHSGVFLSQKNAHRETLVIFELSRKERDEETGFYYYGARYLNSKTSVWISADPAVGDYIPSAPVDDEAKKHNENLPGMCGVFNYVNFHVYHYAGNNPLKYIDPDGEAPQTFLISFAGNVDISNPDSGKTMPVSDYMQGHSHIRIRAGNEFGVDFVLHPGASMKITPIDGTGGVIIKNSSTENKAIIIDALLGKIENHNNDLRDAIVKSLNDREKSREGGLKAGISLVIVLGTSRLGLSIGFDPSQTVAEALFSVPQNTLKLLGAYKEVYEHAKNYEKLYSELNCTKIINLE